MIFGRLRGRKNDVFEWEVLQKPRFGIKENAMLKKIDFGGILEGFGGVNFGSKISQNWSREATKNGCNFRHFFFFKPKRPGGMRGPVLDA